MPRLPIVLLVLAILPVLPANANAQGSPSDPDANSPSGTVYELPFDRARGYAAPRRGIPGVRPGRSRGKSGASSIRSENNFGSSSRVPGVDDADGHASGGAPDGAARESRGDGKPSPSGAGSPPDTTRLAPTASLPSDSGPSSSVVFPLIGLLVVLGVGFGVLAGRSAKRGQRRS